MYHKKQKQRGKSEKGEEGEARKNYRKQDDLGRQVLGEANEVEQSGRPEETQENVNKRWSQKQERASERGV